MYMETVASASPSQYGLIASPGCVLDSVYKRGMKLVFRFELYDMQSGLRLTDRDGSKAEVSLPIGGPIQAVFNQRGPAGAVPPDAPWTWVAVWQIPPDYPLGPAEYAINVTTGDGRTGVLRPSTSGGAHPPQIVD